MIVKGKVIETVTREVEVSINVSNDSTRDQIYEAVRIAGLNQPDSSWQLTSSDGVEVVADIDEPLDEARRIVCEEFYSSSDFNGHQIVDGDGWQHVTHGNEWVCTLYVEDRNPADPTIPMKLKIKFVPDRVVIEWATLNDVMIEGSRNYCPEFFRLRP